MHQSPKSSRIAALTLLLTSAMLAGSASAAPVDTTQRPGPPSTEWNIGSQAPQKPQTPRWMNIDNGQNGPHQHRQAPFMEGGCEKPERSRQAIEYCPCAKPPMQRPGAPLSPEAHKMLEERVKDLRAKLGVTPEQEPAWQKVEQAMRANEASMRAMIKEKRGREGELNAIESMESAQNFAQAHANNLANIIAPFKDLYNSMTEEQRKNADVVFNNFRHADGMRHRSALHHHKHAGKHAHHGRKAAAVATKSAPPAGAPSSPMPAPEPPMPEAAPPTPAPAAQ